MFCWRGSNLAGSYDKLRRQLLIAISVFLIVGLFLCVSPREVHQWAARHEAPQQSPLQLNGSHLIRTQVCHHLEDCRRMANVTSDARLLNNTHCFLLFLNLSNRCWVYETHHAQWAEFLKKAFLFLSSHHIGTYVFARCSLTDLASAEEDFMGWQC